MKKLICAILSALLLMSAASAFALQTDVLDSFAAEISDLQKQTGFLTRWSPADQAELITLINRYGLYTGTPVSLAQYPYPDATVILHDAFLTAYGDAAFWTLEQAYWRDTLLVQLGLQETLHHVLPAEDELTPQEALDIAHDAILAHAQYFQYPTDHLDEYRVSLQYVRYEQENAPLYLVHYDPPDSSYLVFDMIVQQNGGCSFSYHDALAIRNVYQDWYMERGFTRFIQWDLPDKQAFYELLLGLFAREMERYGGLPPIGQTVLSHVHSIPADGEFQPDEALEIALKTVKAQSIDVSALTVTLSFYRDIPDAPSYEVAWVDDSAIVQYAVMVDAVLGSGSIE